jgi:hypothetical protein
MLFCRMANGSLALSRSVEKITVSTSVNVAGSATKASSCMTHSSETAGGRRASQILVPASERNIRQILLTTCVGSMEELEEMLLIASSVFQRVWSSKSDSAAERFGSCKCIVYICVHMHVAEVSYSTSLHTDIF